MLKGKYTTSSSPGTSAMEKHEKGMPVCLVMRLEISSLLCIL